jgi:hypothetical protein
VHREDLFIDDSSDRQAVETVGESFPELNVVPSFALIIEAIDSVDGGTFVVTSEDEEVFRVFNLVRQ